jgi:arylsulfatase A-like enzyme/Tfp pilus assembly protein PilF
VKKQATRQGRPRVSTPGKTPAPGSEPSLAFWRRIPRRIDLALPVLAVLALAAYLAFRFFSVPAAPAFERRPDQNVLLVTIDTLRADAVGAYGGRARTPNMDRLAAGGVRFDFAHAHAVTTLPSHASILTGLYPTQHGIHDNSGFRLSPGVPTLASRLKSQGFETAAFVGAFPLDSRFGLTTGFDLYDDHYPGTSGGREFVLPERRGDAVVALATAWIGAQRGRWLAWVHLFDPHAPYKPPAPFDREYQASPYYGEAAYTDSVLEPLLAAATAASGSQPTLVIVTGDHGEGLGDHGEQTHGLFAYEATLRIPLIVAQLPAGGPGWSGAGQSPESRAGRVVSTPASHVDLVPTVLDLLRMPAAGDLPGRSLLASMEGHDGAVARASYFEALSASLNRGWAPLRGVVAGREKYIDLPLPELYDLGADPDEKANIVDGRQERQRALDLALRAIPASAAATERKSTDAEAAERLRALGYVTGSARPKARYTEADDPKRLIGVDQDVHRAIDLYQRGRAAEAVPIYRQMIASHPTMEVAYSHLAMLQWELGSPDAAVATLRAALAAGVKSVVILTKLGTYLAESGHGSDAVPILQEAVSGDAPDLDALNALGIALARAGRTEEAAVQFRRILQISPAHAMALENLGSIALEKQDYEAARGFFTRALATDPSSAQAHNGLGVVELQSGNRRAAIEHWKAAVATDPANFYALYNVAIQLVADGRRDEARPYLERFARTAPPALYAADIRRVQAMLAR